MESPNVFNCFDFQYIKKGLRNPIKSYRSVRSIFNGYLYKFKYRILRQNVIIGRNFRVRKKLSIRGPGRVIIGDNVVVDGTSHPVTPWTANPNSEIVIGNNVFLNGTRFSCVERIEIGDNCILADCRILDTDFHSIVPDKRNDPRFIGSAPIRIGNNVWIALDSVVLKGVHIGDNSTVAAKSVVYSDVPENSVYGGNPAVFIKRAPSADSPS
jgi:acetyltransferase-like isoleucine patch superfamily enzyme